MNNTRRHAPFSLPATGVGYGKDVFLTCKDVWKFSSSSRYVHIHFDYIRQWATPALVDSLKATLCVEARRVKPRTLQTVMESGVQPLLKHAYTASGELVDHISLGMVQAFAMSLDARRQSILNHVKMLSRALIIHGDTSHGIAHNAAMWLDKQKPPQNQRGEAVLTWDPVKGPLLPSEDRLLMTALHSAFAGVEIQFHDYLKILLFRLSGMRPSQIADLKCKDLVLRDGVYYLNFPQAKKRGEGWRESFEEWALVPEVGALLSGFIAQEQAKWARLGISDGDLPLFVNPLSQDKGRPFHYVGGGIAVCLPSLLYNLKALDPSTRKHVQIRSPRTNRPFQINMRRFRISIATWALAKGANLMEIAKLLGHSGISNTLNAYAAIDLEILEDMDRKMARSEVRTAGYFLGNLIDDTEGLPGKCIYPESFGGISVGKCPNLCAQRKPVACYTCRQFQAFMNGAHEQVLTDLEVDREKVIATSGTSQVNTHDQAIQTVKLVIAMRDERLRRDGLTLTGLRTLENI